MAPRIRRIVAPQTSSVSLASSTPAGAKVRGRRSPVASTPAGKRSKVAITTPPPTMLAGSRRGSPSSQSLSPTPRRPAGGHRLTHQDVFGEARLPSPVRTPHQPVTFRSPPSTARNNRVPPMTVASPPFARSLSAVASQQRPAKPRARRPWTSSEYAALSAGLQAYGGPFWALIKKDVRFSAALGYRTVVDLKDKARNEHKARIRANAPLNEFAFVTGRGGDGALAYTQQ